jgi:hypothetical protein
MSHALSLSLSLSLSHTHTHTHTNSTLRNQPARPAHCYHPNCDNNAMIAELFWLARPATACRDKHWPRECAIANIHYPSWHHACNMCHYRVLCMPLLTWCQDRHLGFSWYIGIETAAIVHTSERPAQTLTSISFVLFLPPHISWIFFTTQATPNPNSLCRPSLANHIPLSPLFH